ncbi:MULTISPECIES: flagellar hook capping FlgD N-terminal domain-containing protein [Pacificibacter]|uniref:flagellar hook capping FlgD N-terminal domain-containing protein n=1 Tax=Pacificibacter TaxID=1042323 RepID=UPI001C07FCF3|nr:MULTISPECIES: flagellar hook capping FlgD N-terminal domain-containing protein [Pacificibacter]MBU2937099.1 flagellar hook assembly protein FlgD [Pacificibacter marinus]MDO6617250.1 flagellar hook capping FlgD N-terminal domain-containing protein [Pacificibacter sp. 1_MG-2023]
MTTVTSATATTSTAAASTVVEEASTSVISSDFETFLTMLTVQLQNQDPMNPIESSDYAVQLATFSGVEQQVQTNDLLRSLASQMGVMSMSQIAGWVGMEARTDAPVYFDGAPVTLAPSPSVSADQTFLIVRDALGNIVQTTEVPATSDFVEWAGVDDNGDPFPSGTYTFELENFAYDEYLSSTSVEAYGQIIEARADGVTTVLVMEGGAEVDAEDISALREPT